MKKLGSCLMALVFSFGILIFFGCSGSNGPPAPTSTTLATSSDANQSITLTGSASALPSGVPASSLTLTPKTAADVPAAPGGASFLLAVECGPAGTNFSQPVTLTFKLSSARTPGEVLIVYLLSGGVWTAAGTGATVSGDGLTASATITHFSTYGLFVTVNAALPGDKYFTFADGVNDGGSPSEIMYDDVNSLFLFPHADALLVTQAYADITKAPYGTYQNSNGLTPPTFTAAAGSVYVLRSTIPTLQYYKLQVISATGHNGSSYGVVTFKYEKILPLDIVNVGEWKFPDNSKLGVLATTIGLDYTAADYTVANNDFYMIDGNYTNQTTFVGTFTRWVNPTTPVTGAVTVTLSLTADGKLSATLTGAAPLGTVTLTGGVKQ